MVDKVDLLVSLGLEDTATRDLKRFQSSVIRTVGSISAAFATLKAILFPITQAASFEREMADVAKTTGYSEQSIQRLSVALVGMSTELGISANELANVAAIAGQLGLGTEGRQAVEDFTESVARASVTLGLTVEQTAEGGAQLSSIFGLAAGDVERIFSTINELSNNSVAAGNDLIDIMKRVGTTSNATFTDVAGLAATMRQLGVPNEQAGTALVKFLGNLLAESKKFAAAMGESQGAWIRRVQNDSTGALKDILATLSEMESAEAAALTKELFGSGRLYSAASKLVGDAANDFEILNKMIELANEGFEEGTSSINEYEKIMETVVKQVDVLKASFVQLSIEVGNKTLPVIIEAVTELSETLQQPEVIDYFASLGEALADIIGWVVSGVKWVANLEYEWTNLGNIIKLIIQYKAAKFFAGIGIQLIGLLAPLKNVWSWLEKIQASLLAFTAAKVGAGAAGAGFTLSSLFGPSFTAGAASTQTALTATAAAATTATKATGLLATALGGLRTILAFIGGPAGVIALAAASLYYWWDEIISFLGFVDKEKAQRERERQQAEKALAKAQADAVADVEEHIEQMRNLYNSAGELKLADKEIGYRITLNGEELQKDTQKIVSEFQLLFDTVQSSSDSVDVANARIAEQATVIAEARAEVADYRQQIADLKAPFEDQDYAGIFPTAEIEELEGKVRELDAVIRTAELRTDRWTANLERFSEAGAKAQDALNTTYLQAVSNQLDTQTSLYAQLKANIAAVTGKVEDLKKRQEDLDKVIDEQKRSFTPVEADEYDAATKAIDTLEASIEQWNTSLGEVGENLSGGQISIRKFIDSMDSDQVQQFANSIKDIEFREGDQLARQFRENANEIIFNYLKLKELRDAYDVAGGAAIAYAKSAKSAFDNTANELIALNRKVVDFATEFKRNLEDRRITIKINAELEEIDENYDQRRQEVEDYYNKRINLATGASRKILENTKKEKLAELDAAQEREKANVTAKNLREQFNSALQKSAELIKDAEKAAGTGDVDRAKALKELAKGQIDTAQGLLAQMRELSTVNIFGKTELKFDDAELLDMLERIGTASGDLNQGIIDTNKDLKDSTEKLGAIWEAATADVAKQFAEAEETVNRMRGIFSNFDDIMKGAEEAFKASTGDLSSVITKFEAIAATPLSGMDASVEALKQVIQGKDGTFTQQVTGILEIEGGVIDPVQLGKDISQAAATGLKGFENAVQLSIIAGLQEASGAFQTVPLDFTLRPSAESKTSIVDELSALVVTPEMQVKQEEVRTQLEDIRATLQVELDVDKVTLPNGKVVTDFTGFAQGGYVRGPGSGTSDSIPAWLSNGEYVIDAFTTSFFGSKFFSGLQAMARGGRRRKSVSVDNLPGYANGGPATGGTDVGSITLNLGSRSFTLYGERRQAQEIVDIFRGLDR